MIPILSLENLKKLISARKNYLLIDVRRPDEVSAYGAIPTAINIPIHALDDALELDPNTFENLYGIGMAKHTKIIFYCRTGHRSEKATEIAISKGFNAYNFKGSVMEWSKIDRNVRMY
jgi:rhodanese-related sulfurtransferase